MRPYCLGISLFFLLNTSVASAAVSINEVAWPHTYFAIVLLISCLWVIFIWVRTVGWQSRCLGKMGVATLLLFFPFVSSATVFINEVAWMGSAASANHEWIELYNSGEAVSVDGWVLSDGMNLNINLTGTIAAGEYAILERNRSDEGSVVGTPFLIYTGALVNTGATLALRDGSSGIVDQVAGGENWQNIGGDNATKETAQYTDAGWVTDTATPGASNGAGRVEESPVNESSSKTSSSGSSGSSKSSSAAKKTSVNLRNPETKLDLEIEAQSIGYVNQLIPFYVSPKGLNEKDQRQVRYEWNLGDSYLKEGRRISHRYLYPGEYLVTVFGRKEKNEQTKTHKITILPVGFSLSFNSKGDVQIHNDTAYDVDISNFVIKGAKEVVFPPRSVILARATITVAGSRLKATSADLVMLYDSSRNLVASSLPKLADVREKVSELAAVQTTQSFAPLPAPPTSNFNFSVEEPETETLFASPEETVLTEVSPAPAGSSTTVRWPYLALIGLILVTYIAIFFGRKSEAVTESKVE